MVAQFGSIWEGFAQQGGFGQRVASTQAWQGQWRGDGSEAMKMSASPRPRWSPSSKIRPNVISPRWGQQCGQVCVGRLWWQDRAQIWIPGGSCATWCRWRGETMWFGSGCHPSHSPCTTVPPGKQHFHVFANHVTFFNDQCEVSLGSSRVNLR